jgi:hypothetical protein
MRKQIISIAGALGMAVAMAAPANAAAPALVAPDASVGVDTPGYGASGWAGEWAANDGVISMMVASYDYAADGYHTETTLQIENSGGTWETAVVCGNFSGSGTEADCMWEVGNDNSAASIQNLASGTPYRVIVQTKSGNTVEATATSPTAYYTNQTVPAGSGPAGATGPTQGPFVSAKTPGNPYGAYGYTQEGSGDGGVADMWIASTDNLGDGYHSETTLQFENSSGTWEPAVVCGDFSGAGTTSYCDWYANENLSPYAAVENVGGGTPFRDIVQTKSGNTVEASGTSATAAYQNQL